MKKTIKVLEAMRSIAIIALVALIGFSFAACSGGDGGGSGGSGGGGGSGGNGTFTLTDIPSQYNGTYAAIVGGPSGKYMLGADKIYGAGIVNLSRISGGRVSIPLWIGAYGAELKRYSGNDTFQVVVQIRPSDNINNINVSGAGTVGLGDVTFSKGSATKSWNAAEYVNID